MHPTTRWEQRKHNDHAARALYQRRVDIDRRLDERRLAAQLREVWT
jgi:hypothetical protein